MNRSRLTLLMALVLSSLISIPTYSQDAAAEQPRQTNGLRVFLDCQRMWCEQNHIRREIPYVNWVRDRQDADVHILAISQSTGGGQEFVFNFIGLSEFAGHVDTLRYTTSRTDVRDEERDGQVLTLHMGLMRFVANTPVADYLSISYNAPRQEEVRAQPEHDPWDYWVFRVGGNGSFNSESLEKHYRTGANFSANRTTEDWMVRLYARGNYSEDRYEYEDIEDSIAVYNNSTASSSAYVIRSLGDHWGAGIRASGGNSVISHEHDPGILTRMTHLNG